MRNGLRALSIAARPNPPRQIGELSRTLFRYRAQDRVRYSQPTSEMYETAILGATKHVSDGTSSS
jgi:hypothetical protein